MSRRAFLDLLCDLYGYEWRINPDGTIDIDTVANLFTTGRVLLSGRTGGRDNGLVGLACDIVVDPDGEDWSMQVRVNDSATTPTGLATIGTNPYVGFDGDPLVMRRYITAPTVTTAVAAGNLASAQLGRFDQIDQAIKVKSDRFDLAADLRPGDTALIEDIDQGLHDPAAQVSYRGELLSPASIRVPGIRWPYEEGMGAAFRYWDGAAFAVVDLTPYVRPEPPGADIEVGSLPRTLATAA